MKRKFKLLALILLVIFTALVPLSSIMAASVTPTIYFKAPDLSGEGLIKLKIDPPVSGIYTDGNITVQVTFSEDGLLLDWSCDGRYVRYVYVKGGNQGGNLYAYEPPPPGVFQDTGLQAPTTGNNNRVAAISNVIFYYHPCD